MRIPLIVVALLILAVTVMANLGMGDSFLRYVHLLPGKDLTGHFLLYGALGFSLSLYLTGIDKLRLTIIGIVAVLIVVEESSHAFLNRRTFSPLDLVASLSGFWVGISTRNIFSWSYPQRERLLGSMINNAVPVLNLFRKGLPWHTTFQELQDFQIGTWGHETFCFLKIRDLCFLPKYEHHDALHVLLGYDTTVVGEARLQAFMVGNHTPTFAGRGLFFLASMMLPEHSEVFAADRKRGVESPTIDWLAIEGALSNPLQHVRMEWRIKNLPSTARI